MFINDRLSKISTISILVLIYLLFVFTNISYAAWLTGWENRKEVNITGQSGAGTDYQVQLLIGESSGASGSDFNLENNSSDFPVDKNDGGDLRFTDNDGTTLLDFWVESISGTTPNRTAKVWVKVDDSLTSNASIYCYYNKSGAANVSNGGNTFILFDDFDGGSLNSSLWTRRNGNAPSFNSSIMSISANGVDPGKIIATAAPQDNNLAIRAKLMAKSGTSNMDERVGVGCKTTNSSAPQGYNFILHDFSDMTSIQYLDDQVEWGDIEETTWLKDNWYVFEIFHDGTNVRGRRDDLAWTVWNNHSGRTGYLSLNIGSFNGGSDWDWALVRKVLATEPSFNNAGTQQGSVVTIEATVGSNGSISPNGSVTIITSSDQIFTIEADTGYHVADVLVDSVSVGSTTEYTFTNVTQNHTISATFEIDTFEIQHISNPGGTFYPSGFITVEYGANQTVLITPEAGYYIQSVSVDGVPQGSITSYTFNNVTADHIMGALFTQIVYKITSEAVANGTISPLGTTNRTYGQSLLCVLTPDTGYEIDELLVDGVPTSYSIILGDKAYWFQNIQANHTISVTFTDEVFTITSEARLGGSISPLGMINKTYGTSQTYTITPDIGYGVSDVFVDGTSVGALTSYAFNNITANHTIEALFYLTMVDAPTNVFATAESSSSILLTWQNNAAQATANHIEKSTNGISYSEIGTTSASSTSYSGSGITGLIPNTRYWFRVRAENNRIYSNYSTAEASYTLCETPNSGTFESVTTTKAKAVWQRGNNPITTYYYCENQTKSTNSGWITGASWESSGLSESTSYTFRVKAKNGDGIETGWLTIGTVSTEGTSQPSSVTIGGINLVSGDIISNQPEILVTAINSSTLDVINKISTQAIDPSTFRLYIDNILITDGTSTYYDNYTEAGGVGTFEYTPKTPLIPGTHDIRIYFIDSIGTVFECEYTGLRVLATVGVIGSPLCYPSPYNPTNGNMTISYTLATDTDTTVYLFNSNGELVWKKKYLSGILGGKAGYNAINWNGRNLFNRAINNGLYLIRVVDSGNGNVLGKTKFMVLK